MLFMRFVTVTELSTLGKSAVGAILAFGGIMQIPQVSAPIMAFGHDHPHIAALIGMLTGLAALLANPQVQKVLNIQVPAGSSAEVNIQTPSEPK